MYAAVMRGGKVVMAVFWAASSALFTLPALGQASDAPARAAARKLGNEGVAAYEADKYDVASEKLERAFAVLQVPSLGLWSARALVKQAKLLEAVERYLKTSRLTISGGDETVQRRAQTDAATEADITQALIPSIIIRVEGAAPADVSLRVDGSAVSSQLIGDAMPINPGAHHVEVSLGAETVASDVTLRQKEQQQVLLKLHGAPQVEAVTPTATAPEPAGAAPSNASRSNVRRTIAWTAIGGGIAGLAVGGVTAGLAMGKRSSLDKNAECASDHRCPNSLQSDVSSYNSLRTISTAGFVVGGVLGATGIVLLVTQPRDSAATSASLWLSPGGVELRGRFR